MIGRVDPLDAANPKLFRKILHLLDRRKKSRKTGYSLQGLIDKLAESGWDPFHVKLELYRFMYMGKLRLDKTRRVVRPK